MQASLKQAHPTAETRGEAQARQRPLPRLEAMAWGLIYGGLLSLLGWGLFLKILLL